MKRLGKAVLALGALVGVCFVGLVVLALVLPDQPKTSSPSPTVRVGVTMMAPQPTATQSPTIAPTAEPTADTRPLDEVEYSKQVEAINARAVAEMQELERIRDALSTPEGKLRAASVAITLDGLANDYRAIAPPSKYVDAHLAVLELATSMEECASALASQEYATAYRALDDISAKAQAAAVEFERVE